MEQVINIGNLFDNGVKKEIDVFTSNDDAYRQQLMEAGSIIGANVEIGRASTSLNNNLNLFLSSCKKKRVLFPLKNIIAYDLCTYLEHLYYTELNDSVDYMNKLISEYLEQNGLSRLVHSGSYHRELSEAFREQIMTYKKVCSDMYSFDIDRSGERILEYMVSSDNDNIHEVIRAHKQYHERCANIEVLSRINKIN